MSQLEPPNRSDSRPPIRVVTAASLFDGHDAAINIMRRLLQSLGAEVIHLGHDRGVEELVEALELAEIKGGAVLPEQRVRSCVCVRACRCGLWQGGVAVVRLCVDPHTHVL